jgi:hypothetical protein
MSSKIESALRFAANLAKFRSEKASNFKLKFSKSASRQILQIIGSFSSNSPTQAQIQTLPQA